MDEDGSGQISKGEFFKIFEVYELWKYENSKASLLEFQMQQQKQKVAIQTCKNIMKFVLKSHLYEFIFNVFIVLNLYFVAIKEDYFYNDYSFIRGFIIANTIINFLCFFEVIFGVIIYGPYEAFRKLFRAWIECLIMAINIFAFIRFVTTYDDLSYLVSTMKLYELCIFIRVIRLLTILSEFDKFRVIIETLKNLMGPFYTILCVMFTIFYVFGIIGSFFFGGII